MLYTFPKFDNSLLVNLTYLFYITLQFISMRNSTHKKRDPKVSFEEYSVFRKLYETTFND